MFSPTSAGRWSSPIPVSKKSKHDLLRKTRIINSGTDDCRVVKLLFIQIDGFIRAKLVKELTG